MCTNSTRSKISKINNNNKRLNSNRSYQEREAQNIIQIPKKVIKTNKKEKGKEKKVREPITNQMNSKRKFKVRTNKNSQFININKIRVFIW